MAEDEDLREDDDEGEDEVSQRRQANLGKKKLIQKQVLKHFKDIDRGFRDQWARANDIADYWDIYDCKLNPNQTYSGDSKIFVPIVRNAIDARKVRFTNQVFPIAGRYVDAISTDQSTPDATASLLEHYIEKANMRTEVMPALMKAGDIEGQYNVYVGWKESSRHVAWRTKGRLKIEGTDTDNPAAEEFDTIEEDEIDDAHPVIEVLSDCDVLVLPFTSDSIDEAVRESGGSATIIRRWTKGKLEAMAKEGWIDEDMVDQLCDEMEKKSPPEAVDQEGKHVDSAGIKAEKGLKFALVYEAWFELKINRKGDRRICRCFYAGKGEQEERILGCHLNPNWSDRLPLLSVPVEKKPGSFKGTSKIKGGVDSLQYFANDAINIAADQMPFQLEPVIMTDPEKNPRVGSMILTRAAVWECDPNSTEIVQFPQTWQQAFEIVNNCKNEISQTLSVSPAAITQGINPQMKSKQNQAMVAQEQAVDLLTTADAVTIVERGILTPILVRMIELDHQHRDEEVIVRQFGQLGVKANMEQIAPIQMEKHYQFRWLGVEAARNAQQIQQQISMANVIMQFPKEALKGYAINLVPVATHMIEQAFGPRVAPQVFEKPEDQMPIDPNEENMLLSEGFEVPVHKLDPDDMHIQSHIQLLQMLSQQGPSRHAKKIQAHVWLHQQQKQQKQMAQMGMGEAMQQGQRGGQAKPQKPQSGGGGGPKPGAMAGAPRGGQGPPGMIPQDQMTGPSRMMPRKMGGWGV